MLRFEGSEAFRLTPTDLFAKLSDAGWLAQALPDTEVSTANADRAEWKVKPKFQFMAGTLDTIASVLERVPPESVRYSLVSKGVGSSSTLIAVLNFRGDEAGGTTVAWTGELTELGGLLKLVPRPLLQATAQKVIAELWEAIRAKTA